MATIMGIVIGPHMSNDIPPSSLPLDNTRVLSEAPHYYYYSPFGSMIVILKKLKLTAGYGKLLIY